MESQAPSDEKEHEVKAESNEEEVSATIEADTVPGNAVDGDAMKLDEGTENLPQLDDNFGDAGVGIESEPKIPLKRNATLREFLGKMDDYAPIIPDAVTNYYMTKAGLPPPPETPQHLTRLLALATQKFISDIAADAYQYARIRSSNTTSNNPVGGLGGAAAFGTQQAGGAAVGGGGGGGGGAAAAAAAGNAGAKDGQQQGKGTVYGVQRPGFGGGGQGGSQGKTVLTMEDLGMALGEYGVNVKRGEFYR